MIIRSELKITIKIKNIHICIIRTFLFLIKKFLDIYQIIDARLHVQLQK